MKSHFKYFNVRAITLMLLIAMVFVNCNSNNEELTLSVPINVSTISEENRKIATDLTSFDYRELVKEKLSLTDEKVLSNINWSRGEDAESQLPTFQIILKQEALAKKTEINATIKTFVEKKLSEYKSSLQNFDDLEIMAEYYLSLIEVSSIDTIWIKVSPNLKRYASKDDFHNSLKQRKELFKPLGKRSIESRRVATELGDDLKGEFCTLVFVYENDEREEVTLEKIDNEYKLLGYRFYMKK